MGEKTDKQPAGKMFHHCSHCCPAHRRSPRANSLRTLLLLLLLVPAGPRALTQELHGEVAGLGQQAPADDGLLGGVQGVPHDERDACGDSGARCPRAGTAQGPRFPPAPRGAAAGRGSGPCSFPHRFSQLPSPLSSWAAPRMPPQAPPPLPLPRSPGRSPAPLTGPSAGCLCWGTWGAPPGVQSMHSSSYPTCSTPESLLGKSSSSQAFQNTPQQFLC